MAESKFCPFLTREVCFEECKKCKAMHCEDFMVAIIADFDNIQELDLLNQKVLSALNGRKAVIVSNKIFESAAYAISTSNNFEFVYSYVPDKEFGCIPEMAIRYNNSAVIFTGKDTCDRFMKETKVEMDRLDIHKKLQIRLFDLKGAK